jgi:hypothetical protein
MQGQRILIHLRRGGDRGFAQSAWNGAFTESEEPELWNSARRGAEKAQTAKMAGFVAKKLSKAPI